MSKQQRQGVRRFGSIRISAHYIYYEMSQIRLVDCAMVAAAVESLENPSAPGSKSYSQQISPSYYSLLHENRLSPRASCTNGCNLTFEAPRSLNLQTVKNIIKGIARWLPETVD